MIRSLLLSLCAFVFFVAVQPAQAQRLTFMGDFGNTVVDPNHLGYVLDEDDYPMPVRWSPVKAECDPCQALADAYNQTMQSLMNTRYWIQEVNSTLEDGAWTNKKDSIPAGAGDEGLDENAKKALADALSYKMGLDEMQGRLSALRAQEESLKTLGDDLLDQLHGCEQQMCKGPGNKEYNRIGDPIRMPLPLPFDWRGPYPDVCTKCAKLAARLNELPTLARVANAGLEAARADLMFAEMEIQAIQLEHNAIGIYKKGDKLILPDNRDPTQPQGLNAVFAGNEKVQKDFDKKSKRKLDEQFAKKDKAERDIAKYEHDLDEITKNFEATLKLYNDCVPTCTPAEKKTSMVDPGKADEGYALSAGTPWTSTSCKLSYEPQYVIGANSEYGTGAAMKEKAKGMATGAAMGALNGVLGGSGIQLGGGNDKGGGMEKIDGPDLDKNPLGKGGKWEGFKWEGRYVGMEAGWFNDGLVVNQEIKDSPDGNSTFHATWLQDSAGRVTMPTSYYIYDIYRDHKLTVWWTYDHWTNGVHDDHDEGEETTKWREDLGSLKVRFGGNKGIENSLWYQSGYDTAVKGVRKMGSYYEGITPDDLKGCGLYSMTYLTMPSEDPVVAVPFPVNLRLDEKERKEADERFLNTLWVTAPQF